jgi:UDP-2,4-diacetamido-2,4,6-trideoxy-beta-L-altropyranose hydrolase
MKILIRADASLQIGTGHVMRCLTLANALRDRGAVCRFVCRAHAGNLLERIRQNGFEATALPLDDLNGGDRSVEDKPNPLHAPWLGANWRTDAAQTIAALRDCNPDWLIVDHYALDYRWESQLKSHCGSIMVIDDLADRIHDCDLLLDQTFGRGGNEYANLVPNRCVLLLSSKYALLRPEFAKFRCQAIQQRLNRKDHKVLVSFGGGDNYSLIAETLKVISYVADSEKTKVHVITGYNCVTAIHEFQKQNKLAYDLTVERYTTEMPVRMLWADLAIGAGGSTSWERCCMALPSVLLILAENQKRIGQTLADVGAAFTINSLSNFTDSMGKAIKSLLYDSRTYTKMCKNAVKVCDGDGVNRVINFLLP